MHNVYTRIDIIFRLCAHILYIHYCEDILVDRYIHIKYVLNFHSSCVIFFLCDNQISHLHTAVPEGV